MTSTTTAPAGIDPAVFTPQAVTDDTATATARVLEAMAGIPSASEREPAAIRAERAAGGGAFGPIIKLDDAEERTIEGPRGTITLRTLVPPTVDGAYLHIHGGGWVMGSADGQDERLWATAQAANLAVVSVEYGLAPEDAYPAGPNDCEAAAVWAVEHAAQEFGSDALVIGGESAGGNLAAVTLVRMRERHGYSGFRAANLVYGAYDLAMTPSMARGERAPVWPTPSMRWAMQHYAPGHDLREPDISPLYADLSGLPPALFTVGTLDSLLDDSLFMHQRWIAAGNEAELAVYAGGVHGFNGFPMQIGREANDRQNEFLRRTVSGEA